AYHEAGHALVSVFCEHADPLHKVTVIPRGKMLGGAMYFPEGEKVTTTRSEIIDRMVIACGGRCAEEMVFGEQNSGAAGDIRQVSHLARSLVMRLGMSEKLGFLEYSTTNEDMGYLGHLSRPEYSEKTACMIDEEVRKLVNEALAKARSILQEHREKLDLLANKLLERETLSGAEVYELLGLSVPEVLQNAKIAEDEKHSDTKSDAGAGEIPDKCEEDSAEPPDDHALTGGDIRVDDALQNEGDTRKMKPSQAETASKEETQPDSEA
ncbi:MAG: hypothetical protein D6820_04335, partial [Lentisphaerae bacterium]